MAGTSTNSVRSSHLAETVPGVILTTPAFKTMHAPIIMMAKPDIIQGRSQIAGGGRLGRGIQGIDVSGSYEDSLKYGVNDDLLATLLQGSWTANVLKDGKEFKTVSVENSMTAGAGGALTHLRYPGVEAMSGKLALKAKTAAMLSLELFGLRSENASTSIIAGATYVNPTVFDPISSGANVGTLTMGGYDPLDCMEALDIDFAFDQRTPQPKIGSDDFCGMSRGSFIPTLMANMYVEAGFAAIYNAARTNHATFALEIVLGIVTLQKYRIRFPACRFGATEIDMSGANVMQKVEILPEYDAASQSIVTITRAVA